MLFNEEDYDADSLFRVYSERFYSCLVKNDETTKNALIKCRKDWGGKVDKKEFPVFFKKALHRNQMFKELTLDFFEDNSFPREKEEAPKYYPPEKGSWLKRPFKALITRGIYKRENDECIGWSTGRTVWQETETSYDGILPEYRNDGAHTEIEMAMLKFLFSTCNWSSIRFRLALSESNEKITWIQMAEYFSSEEFETLDRGYPVRYAQTTLTKESIAAWMEENLDFKNQYYDYELNLF